MPAHEDDRKTPVKGGHSDALTEPPTLKKHMSEASRTPKPSTEPIPNHMKEFQRNGQLTNEGLTLLTDAFARGETTAVIAKEVPPEPVQREASAQRVGSE